ncbi:hypothetical protein N0O92_13240 [Alkalihalobacillus sp. MEB130]|uniref:hypothetical protein n=1 Tax=Alkalihalobacillus sp. MEB130 TaxID=2976704 RepID=UPI0028DF6AC8|nr:hypothetical protein [Alkalihalobacillus sp. MEB130]MDT8861200.1 hypothetical protein [Alkalihalobacillus sp. MEB130]
MFHNNSEEIRQIIKKANSDDNQAKSATALVNHIVTEMDPQRREAGKSQNRR